MIGARLPLALQAIALEGDGLVAVLHPAQDADSVSYTHLTLPTKA